MKSPIRILYIEDHIDTASAFKILLERMGFQVDIAHTAFDARSRCVEREYDLWLIDLGLPDGHGGSLLKSLRRISDTKAIAFTGFGLPHDIADGLADGFDDYLVKPASVEDFLQAVKRISPASIPQTGGPAVGSAGST